MKYNYPLLAGLAFVALLSGKVESASASQAISQQCNFDAQLPKVNSKELEDKLVSSCKEAKDSLVKKDPTKEADLNSEWEVIQKRIQEHKKMQGDGRFKTLSVRESIRQNCNFQLSVNSLRNAKDLEVLLFNCLNVYARLLSANPSKQDEFNKEWKSIMKTANELFDNNATPEEKAKKKEIIKDSLEDIKIQVFPTGVVRFKDPFIQNPPINNSPQPNEANNNPKKQENKDDPTQSPIEGPTNNVNKDSKNQEDKENPSDKDDNNDLKNQGNKKDPIPILDKNPLKQEDKKDPISIPSENLSKEEMRNDSREHVNNENIDQNSNKDAVNVEDPKDS